MSLSLDESSTREDRHRRNIVAVFDDLKDYLSESDLDLSLDYKIALKRRKNKLDYAKQVEEIRPGRYRILVMQILEIYNFYESGLNPILVNPSPN